jgi:hypothetical protein
VNTNPVVKPSNAHNPDLDWSQVRETVMLLNVAIAQIENALRSGDESVAVLAESFTSMMGNIEEVAAAAENLPQSNEASTIQNNCSAVSQKMHAAIIAFQFYDKLAQRLTHLTHSLDALSELVKDPDDLYNPYSWRGLQQRIKAKYTLESDKAMFEAILAGHPVAEALRISQEHESHAAQKDDDIELF